MRKMFQAPTTIAQVFITTVMAISLLACGKDDSAGDAQDVRHDAASVDARGALDASRILDGVPPSTGHDGRAELSTDVSTSVDGPAKLDGAQGSDAPAKLLDGGGEAGSDLDATDDGDSASRVDTAAGDASSDSATRDSASSVQHDGPAGHDLAAKTDLAKIPDGTPIQPHRIMHLAASDFPYQTFVNNWDDDKYPVLYALIQSSAEFGTYLHPAATMGSSGFAPTDKEFSEYGYVLIARVVDDSSQPATFDVEALIASGTSLNVLYTFQKASIPGTSTKKDGLLIEFPKRSLSKVTLYENRTVLGSLDIANGKNDVTTN